MGTALAPAKANPPFVIDADRVLAFAITCQGLQMVSWWYTEVIQTLRRPQQRQFAARLPLKCLKSPHHLIVEKAFGIFIGEASDHFYPVGAILSNGMADS
jgi:hypothetical protein